MPELVPVGSVVDALWWWNTPDKYAGPARFDTLAGARAHNPIAQLTIEVRLRTPDGGARRVVGAVTTVDDFVRRSPRQDPGVLPTLGATVVELVRRTEPRTRYGAAPEPTEQTRIEDAYDEVVFRDPAGGRFVLLPLTTHPLQD
ncbi:hypothetical protein [Plantactinospora sonchi]|uniref:Uncharacterized protein n=1 Tax=Plantactinospora sonchi TaxID=1544735 RepID=A0ABU7RR89_9ACTN